MKTFPVNFVLEDRPAVVVGAGRVGLRKIRSLINAGAKVTVFAGKDNRRPDGFDAQVRWIEEDFTPGSAKLIAGAALVFACCDDRKTNSAVARECRKMSIPVNCADQPEDCDFFCPSTAARGDVTLAVGTGGTAPALAAKLRRRLENALPENIGDFAQAMGQLRNRLVEQGIEPQVRMEIMKKLAEDEYLELYDTGGGDALTKAVEAMLNTGKS